MIIDFHTHAFPDKIAHKTIEMLKEKARIPSFCNGTVSCLRQSMEDASIDVSVVLPIATRPGQEETINKFASEINNTERIISFGSIHPKSKNYKEILDQIKDYGLKGIKFHPDYQNFYVDDERTYKIVEYAAKLDLVIVYHAGLDLGIRGPIKNTPIRAKRMLDSIGYDKIVLAHMGGHALAGDVLEVLCGLNVYFDTAFSMGKMPDKDFLSIIKEHGADKILFGSDNPWDNQKDDVEYFHKLNLPNDVKEKILYKNALELLK